MAVWKDIPGYEGLYQVSTRGKVKSLARVVKRGVRDYALKQRIMRPGDCHGYMRVILYKQNIAYNHDVHRLVAETFIPNPDNKRTVNHKNGNRADNRVENLEWATYKENNLHSYRILGNKGSAKGKFGKDNPSAKPVVQMSINGEYIKTWGSQVDAERSLGIHSAAIRHCLSGRRKTGGGYKWKFAN